jgi:hypothetical protein
MEEVGTTVQLLVQPLAHALLVGARTSCCGITCACSLQLDYNEGEQGPEQTEAAADAGDAAQAQADAGQAAASSPAAEQAAAQQVSVWLDCLRI